MLFARSDAQVQKIEDTFTKELIVSASGAASKLNWTVLKNTLGVKFKILSGYQGSNDSMLAMLRGEVDALSQPWSILKISGDHLIRDNKIHLLLQTGAEKDADLPQVPRMIDLARNDEERKLLELFASPSLIGRSVLAPPGLPPERVAELRRAFMADDAGPGLPRRREEGQARPQSDVGRSAAGGHRQDGQCPGFPGRACPAGCQRQLNPPRSRVSAMGTMAQVRVQNSTMDVYVDGPARKTPSPAIILMYHRGGIDKFTKLVVERLVGAGYLVAVPEISHRCPQEIPIADRKALLKDSRSRRRYRGHARLSAFPA